MLSEWCEQQGIEWYWIQPGKPTQNAYIERFNGTFRREVLDAYSFANLAQAREVVDRWLDDYNRNGGPYQTAAPGLGVFNTNGV